MNQPAPQPDSLPHHPESEAGSDQVVYRRRQEDWMSGTAPPGDDPPGAARRAAVEVAKAILISRDGLTSDHSDDVAVLCAAIAREFDLDGSAREDLLAAAQLHDIGKVAVPESILQKPGPLTEAEWDFIRDHTIVGERILAAVPELIAAAALVRHSHEHLDGSGYPDGLSGDAIPLESRIILCADAFHAIRSPRPYRDGRSAAEAYEEIRAHSGRQFDPAVVEALARTIKSTHRRRRAARALKPTRPVLGNRRLPVLLLAPVDRQPSAAPRVQPRSR
jgi:HD-GYP domain-containing protein (c-di-GMP phosphodiesterase class II)